MHFIDLILPKSVMVTEQQIDLTDLTEGQWVYFINLFQKIITHYEQSGKNRFVFGFTGPTGAGKSVLLAIFKDFALQSGLNFEFTTIGIDAFHYANDFLESHYSETGTMLKEIKGSPETYDVQELAATLKTFTVGKAVSLPEYSRRLHEPIKDIYMAFKKKSLLLLEGLWLLYEKEGWSEVRELIDYMYYIQAGKESVENDVIKRHMQGGRTAQEAREFYHTVDFQHFDLIEHTKHKADEIISSFRSVI